MAPVTAPPTATRAKRGRRILVLYEMAGGGHYTHAKAIRDAFRERLPECEVTLMQVTAASGNHGVARLYLFYNRLLARAPGLVLGTHRLVSAVNLERLCMDAPLFPQAKRAVMDAFQAARPDVIVSVFSSFNYPALQFREKLGWARTVPYLVFVTDLTRDFVRSWVDPEMDLVIAMLPETRDQLLAYGVPERKIKLLNGIPVAPDFRGPRVGRAEARRRLGLQAAPFTVLLTLGGVAVAGTLRLARQLVASGLPVQLVVVCGRNDSLRRQVDRLAAGAKIPVTVYGFTDQMPLLMDAADAAIAKPGPATIAELVFKEVPLLLDATVPPMLQERGNLELVLREGLGWAITAAHPAATLVRELMEHPERAEALRAKMRRFQHADALDELVQTIATAQVDPARRQVWRNPVRPPRPHAPHSHDRA